MLEEIKSLDTKTIAKKPKTAKQKKSKPFLLKLKMSAQPIQTLPSNYYLITDTTNFNRMLRVLATEEEISFDSETLVIDDVDWANDRLVGLSLYAPNADKAYYVPVRHRNDVSAKYDGAEWYLVDEPNNLQQLETKFVLDNLVPILKSKKLITFNGKYDKHILLNEGSQYNVGKIYFDGYIAGHVLNENDAHLGLKGWATKYLKIDSKSYSELFGNTKFDVVPIDIAVWYACKDSVITYQLYQYQYFHLSQRPKLMNLFQLEMDLMDIVLQIERNGVPINLTRTQELHKELEETLLELEKKFKDEIKWLLKEKGFEIDDFNINSNKQLADILFNKLKMKPLEFTEKGQPKFDKSSIPKYAQNLPVLNGLLDYRKVAKLYTTYTKAFLEQNKNGYLYPTFNQVGTDTGRFSGVRPNMQNLPAKDDFGKKIRQLIEAPEGYYLVSIDYSQIELRVLAAMSKDPILVDAYKKGDDIHTRTASEVFRVPIDEVPDKLRSIAKSINFGLVYGQSEFGLAEKLGISVEEAKKYIEQYFATYKGVKRYLDRVVEEGFKKGYVETFFGRKRRILPLLKAEHYGFASRVCKNAPIQGTASDIMKFAIVALAKDDELKQYNYKTILQVHDELVFIVKAEHLKAFCERASHIMKTCVGIGVPLETDIEIYKNWAGEKLNDKLLGG